MAHIEKQHKLHKRAARVITGSNYEIRSSEIFEKLCWEKIEIILRKREHIMTFKALRGKTPNYLSDLFVAIHNDTYKLRSNDRKLFKLNKPDTIFMKNSLPAEIVDIYDQLSLYCFKTLINHHYKDLEGKTSTT
jgi:hypothetical protein